MCWEEMKGGFPCRLLEKVQIEFDCSEFWASGVIREVKHLDASWLVF